MKASIHCLVLSFICLVPLLRAESYLAVSKSIGLERKDAEAFRKSVLAAFCVDAEQDAALKALRRSFELWSCPKSQPSQLYVAQLQRLSKERVFIGVETIDITNGLLLDIQIQESPEVTWQTAATQIPQQEAARTAIKLSLSVEASGGCHSCEELRLAKELIGDFTITRPHEALKHISKQPLQRSNMAVYYTTGYSLREHLFGDPISTHNSLDELRAALQQRETTMQPGGDIRIIKTHGAWVYLNKGRAFGLRIRDRLVVNDDIKMHIISYYSTKEQIYDGDTLVHDGAIAFVRKGQDLVRPGEVLQLDPLMFPTDL